MYVKQNIPQHLVEYITEILDQANIGITVTDPKQPDNPIIYANQSFRDKYNYKEEDYLGKNCRFLQGKDTQQQSSKDIKKALEQEKAISTIIRNYKKNGELVYNQITISPIYDSENKLNFFLGVQKDITKLHNLLEQTKTTESLANIGYWELNLDTDVFYWSDKVYKLFEMNKNILNPTYESFLDVIHPDDKKKVDTAYKKSLITKEKSTIKHRLLLNDGRIKYVEEKFESYTDKDGKPFKFVGTIQDITYIKNMELELQNTLSFLKSHKLAIDESSIVSKSDKEGIITYVNDNFCKISGYTKDEVIGKAHSIIKHPDNPDKLFCDLWSTIKAKNVWKKIIKNQDKSGKSYWVDTTILPILDQNNNIEEYIAIRYDVTQMIKQQNKLNYIANNDLLTGLGNRYKLLNDIQESSSSGLAVLNIDNFSHLNDFYGYEIGDLIIKEFAKELTKSQECDKTNLYHLNGDEFVVFYNNIENDTFVQKIFDLEQELKNVVIYVEEENLTVNFSVGISFEAKEKILVTANMALKIAKNKNKNIVVFNEEISLNKEYANNLKWTKVIKNAINEDKVIPVFQPIVNNITNKWEKYEALVRIESEERLITPYFFLEISKKTRHYTSITKMMIQKTVDLFKNKSCEFSVNLTIDDILNSEIQDYIFLMLQRYKVGKRLVFEIVESESIENFDTVIEFINNVKIYGCKIAIDDFGTGYSNFQYLVRLNADYLKIDGSLIQDVDTNITSEIVIKNLVNFAKDLGIKTIAEYVENESIFNKVKELGIDYSQGYYFSEPKKDIEKLD